MRHRGPGRLCLALAALIGLNAARAEEAPIRVAVEGAYPPFNYIENDTLQGFEVDLLKALCAAMAARCMPVQHQWEGIVRGLIEGRYDAIMSSLQITPRRRKRIAFSRPYYRIPTAFIARKEADLPAVTPQALAGLRIGAVERSRAAALVEGRYGGAELRTYGKLEEANLDLFTERLDLVVGDKLALSRFLASREGACCRFVGDVPPQAEADDGYGIGLRPEDTALKARFDRAIDEVMADGTYDRIRARYIPFDTK